jgi:dockerin type I repeat protein
VLRVYGDVDDSGAVDTSDKLEINRELNGIATTATLRELDLTGDGVVDTNDKLQVNRLLNGIAVP